MTGVREVQFGEVVVANLEDAEEATRRMRKKIALWVDLDILKPWPTIPHEYNKCSAHTMCAEGNRGRRFNRYLDRRISNWNAVQDHSIFGATAAFAEHSPVNEDPLLLEAHVRKIRRGMNLQEFQQLLCPHHDPCKAFSECGIDPWSERAISLFLRGCENLRIRLGRVGVSIPMIPLMCIHIPYTEEDIVAEFNSIAWNNALRCKLI